MLNDVELEENGDPSPLADGDTLVIGTDTTAKVKVRKCLFVHARIVYA